MRNEKKHRGRLGGVDWLLILLALGGVLLGILFLYGRRHASTPTLTVEYTVLVAASENLLEDSYSGWEDLIPIGARVTSSNGTAHMGQVVAVESRSRLVLTIQKETPIFVEHPSDKEVLIRIRANAIATERDCLRVQDIRVGVGMHGDYRIGRFFAGNAQIVALTVIDS